MNTLSITEENQKLRERYALLRQQLADLFAQKDEMLTYEESSLIAMYTTLIGTLQYEEFVLQTEIGQLKMKLSLIQAYVNRKEKIDYEEIKKEIAAAFVKYQEQIKAQAEAIKAAKEFIKAPMLTIEETAELKTIYRFLVKRLHPDWNPNQTEKEKDLFLRTQTAYKMTSLQDLRAIVLMLEANDQVPIPDISLMDEVKNLEQKIQKLQIQINQLNQQFPFTFRDNLKDEEWIKKRQQEIRENIENLTEQKQKYQSYIELFDNGNEYS